MSDSATLLRYLARLAPDRDPKAPRAVARRSDLAPLGWLHPRSVLGFSDEAPPALERSPRLDRLYALDRLHSSEHLLRIGWLWLAGSEERADERFLAPVLSVPVRLDRKIGSYALAVLGDPGIMPGLIPNGAVRDVLDDAQATAFTLAGPVPPEGPVLARYTQFKAWLRQVTEEIGVLTPDVVPPTIDPWELRERSALALGLAVCVYLGRDVDAPTVRTDLANWAGRNTSRTAFAAVFASSPPEDTPANGDDVVDSPFPLNGAQRAAILRSRSEAVTVVSGPPGTGKSHLAAALAVDEVARGHSVLLATQSDHAADVLAALLDRHAGPQYVRFGSRERRRRMADELAGGLAVPYDDSDVDRLVDDGDAAADRVRSARSRIVRLLRREIDFERGLADRSRLAPAIALAPGVADGGVDVAKATELHRTAGSAAGLLAERRRARADAKLRELVRAVPEATLADLEDAIAAARAEELVRAGMVGGGLVLRTDWEELEAAEAAWREATGRVIEARRRSRENRKRTSSRAVSGLATALRAGRSKRRSLLRDLQSEDFLDVLPLWLGSLRDIDETLPADPAVFDVVILDEASQIDLMRSAPALCRARRAVVFGDPAQLRHVSFVSDEAMTEAAAAEGIDGSHARQLDARRNSLFDAAAAVTPVTDLVEHFRSVPHIIEFSDRRFYGDRLRLMTQHPGTEQMDAIRVVNVTGARNDDGWIEAEVAAAGDEVRSILDAGGRSVGVLCPFRSQADALEAMLLERFTDHELETGDLRVGTVHAFQGSERDMIVATLGLGAADVTRSLSFVENPHLFNVMVTRARKEMVVVTSLPADVVPPGLLTDYLRWSEQAPRPSRSADPASGWIADLAASMAAYQVPVVAGYPVAGYEVDLAVGDDARALGVECAVFRDDPDAHIERHQALARASWHLRDAYRSRWLANQHGAVADLVAEVLSSRVQETNPERAAGQ